MIALIDYNAGNISSVKNALARLGQECIVTRDPDEIRGAEKVILPGVGEASNAMNALKQFGLDECILQLTQPFLGICLGMQLMCNSSEEGNTKCLGIFDAKVKLFPPEEKVPHMGWNELTQLRGPLFNTMNEQSEVYFVHSYFAELSNFTTSQCDYILPFSASLQKDNFFATQFHPEKSGVIGEQMIKNFLKL